MCILPKSVILISIFLGIFVPPLVSGTVTLTPSQFSHNEEPRPNYHSHPNYGSYQTWILGQKFVDVEEKINRSKSPTPTIIPISQSRSRNGEEDRGALGLYILGYLVKGGLYYYTYFKLMCVCMGISVLFLLLCPLLPFLIPALILILLVAAGLSIAIPLIVTAVGAGDEDLLLITN